MSLLTPGQHDVTTARECTHSVGTINGKCVTCGDILKPLTPGQKAAATRKANQAAASHQKGAQAMTTLYAIQTPLGYVTGFSAAHQCVQATTDTKRAKLYKTEQAAQNFIDTYAGAGYGLSAESSKIVKVAK